MEQSGHEDQIQRSHDFANFLDYFSVPFILFLDNCYTTTCGEFFVGRSLVFCCCMCICMKDHLAKKRGEYERSIKFNSLFEKINGIFNM